MYLSLLSIFPFVCLYLCTYIRLLCENAITNPPQTSREGQRGGKEGFKPSGYSSLNQEKILKAEFVRKVKKCQFRAEGGLQSKSFIPETPLKMTINGGSNQVKSKIGGHLEVETEIVTFQICRTK